MSIYAEDSTVVHKKNNIPIVVGQVWKSTHDPVDREVIALNPEQILTRVVESSDDKDCIGMMEIWQYEELTDPFHTLLSGPYAEWDNNEIQFPRLIAEMQMAGAFSEDVIMELCESMDLEPEEVQELVNRACDAWDEIKAGR